MKNTCDNVIAGRRSNLNVRLACFAIVGLLCVALAVFQSANSLALPSSVLAPSRVRPLGRPRSRRARQLEPRSASYSRFSSDLQDPVTIETQQEQCRECAQRDDRDIELQYDDRAVSGTVLEREGLDRLLADAEAGRFNCVYFYSLSRSRAKVSSACRS